MTRSFSIPATSSVARRLLQLAAVTDNVSVDEGIVALAEEGALESLLSQSELTNIPKMKPEAEGTIQDLLDLDLRAVIGVQRGGGPEGWLHPVLTAARLKGIDELAYDHTDRVKIRKVAEMMGFRTIIEHKKNVPLPEVSAVSRGALYIVGAQAPPTTLWAPAMEMKHTVVIAPTFVAKRFALYPDMIPASAIYRLDAERLRARGFINLTSQSRFFFNCILLDGK